MYRQCRHIQWKLLGWLLILLHQQCQHVAYPGSCKSCFSRILVFGGKVLLIFPIIYQIAHLYTWPTWPDELFDLCWNLPWMTQLLTLGASFPVSQSIDQFALKFHWVKMCFGCINSVDIEITYKLLSVMPKLVFLMTVQEAHKEYSSLMEKIRAKYEQLDSGEFGSPGIPAFDA